MDLKQREEETDRSLLNNAIEALSVVNVKLEECAIRWKCRVSKKQWEVISLKPQDPKRISLINRTYFENERLDAKTHSVLEQARLFTQDLEKLASTF